MKKIIIYLSLLVFQSSFVYSSDSSDLRFVGDLDGLFEEASQEKYRRECNIIQGIVSSFSDDIERDLIAIATLQAKIYEEKYKLGESFENNKFQNPSIPLHIINEDLLKKTPKAMRVLDLGDKCIDFNEARRIASGLKDKPIDILDIHSNPLGNRGVDAITSSLNSNTHTLDIGDTNAEDISNSNAYNTGNKSAVYAIKNIALATHDKKTKSSIVNLYLYENQLTDEGIAEIFYCLYYTNISFLDVSRNHFTDNGIIDLIYYLPHTSISYLCLGDNEISHKKQKELEKTFPLITFDFTSNIDPINGKGTHNESN